MPDDDGYQPRDDFARSIDECYRVIRERMAAGGKGWEPKVGQLKVKEPRELVERRASKAAASIIAKGAAAEIAERVKDAGALEKALIGKLNSQRDFAAQYRATFPADGVNTKYRADDSTVVGSHAAEWCLGFGFHVRTVQRWCELLDAAGYTEKKNAILKRCWQLAELWQAANYSSASVEWYTPARYLDAVRELLGGIDLDPASSEQANRTVRAERIFTQADDGLARDWSGRIFLNPPYGRTESGDSLAGAFCVKAIEQFEGGKIDAGVILVNSLHSQSWQAPLYEFPVCFVDHRIQFVSGDGELNKNPTFQNIFVYLGRDVSKFAAIFGRLGYVMKRIEA